MFLINKLRSTRQVFHSLLQKYKKTALSEKKLFFLKKNFVYENYPKVLFCFDSPTIYFSLHYNLFSALNIIPKSQ
jgi:hypothetical protein